MTSTKTPGQTAERTRSPRPKKGKVGDDRANRGIRSIGRGEWEIRVHAGYDSNGKLQAEEPHLHGWHQGGTEGAGPT